MKINEVTQTIKEADNPVWNPVRRPKYANFDKKPEEFGVAKKFDRTPPKWHKDASGKIVYDNPAEADEYRKASDAYYSSPEYNAYQRAMIAHNKAEQAKIEALHKTRGGFDYQTTITNPKFDPNSTEDDVAMGADDDDTSWEDLAEPEEITVGIDYDLDPGERATRDNPGHSASVEFTRVVDLDTGEDITKFIDFDTDEWNQIEIDIVEQASNNGDDDYDGHDDYYDESVQLEAIKKLSGLK